MDLTVMPKVVPLILAKTACGLWGCMAALIIETALVAEFVPSTNENALRAAVAVLFLYRKSEETLIVFETPATLMLLEMAADFVPRQSFQIQ